MNNKKDKNEKKKNFWLLTLVSLAIWVNKNIILLHLNVNLPSTTELSATLFLNKNAVVTRAMIYGVGSGRIVREVSIYVSFLSRGNEVCIWRRFWIR